MNLRQIAIGLRTVYVAFLLYYPFIGLLPAVVGNLPAFIVTLPLFFMGKKDKRYYMLDIGIIGIFLVNLSLFIIGFWSGTDNPLGFDKVLHFAAGVWVGALALVVLSRWIKDRFVLAVCALACVGAMAGYWEVFEWIGSIVPPPFYLKSTGYDDSMMDIIAVTLGGLLSIGVWHMRSKK